MDLLNSEEFNQHVQNLIDEWHAPGLSIAIVQDETIASRGYGKATLEPEKPFTADTLCDIASSSKSLTAGAVALLVADDEHYPKIKWETTMSSLLPDDFVMSQDSYTQDVTVEDILSHRTGLPGHDNSYMSIRATHPDTPQSVTRNLRNLEISAAIRTRFQYCNLMFTVATHLVEHLSAKSFADFIRERFFNPLGMDSTHLQPDATKAAGLEDRMATQYCWNEDEKRYAEVEKQQCPEAQGAGSIFTSANDYIKWVKAMMNQEHPVSETVYKGLIKPRIVENPDADEMEPCSSHSLYNVGISSFHYRGYQVVSHNGLIEGSGSCHFFVPELKFGGVILANSDSASDLGDILCHEFVDEVLKVPSDERPDWNARQHRLDSKYKEEQKKDELPVGSPLENLDLSVYTGRYSNLGYHEMKVEIKNDALFIDATDRTNGYTLTFKNRDGKEKFAATLSSYFEPGIDVEKFEAEFRFQDEKVMQMGLKLEPQLDGLIWFDKIND